MSRRGVLYQNVDSGKIIRVPSFGAEPGRTNVVAAGIDFGVPARMGWCDSWPARTAVAGSTRDGCRRFPPRGDSRTSAGYTTDTGNQLTSDGTWTYTHDNEGNRTKKSKGATQETWTYGYDHWNQLVWVEQRATDGGTLLQRIDYSYDALGRLIQRLHDSDGNGGTDTNARSSYDGRDAIAELNGSSGLVMLRLFGGTAMMAPEARVAAGAIVAWYMADRQGSIVALSDYAGVVQSEITYDGFGKILTETGASFGDDYKYTGQRNDDATDLQIHNFRWYDAATGRWLSRDPIGFAAGDANLYRYVANNATNYIDPSGLEGFSGLLDYLWQYSQDIVYQRRSVDDQAVQNFLDYARHMGFSREQAIRGLFNMLADDIFRAMDEWRLANQKGWTELADVGLDYEALQRLQAEPSQPGYWRRYYDKQEQAFWDGVPILALEVTHITLAILGVLDPTPTFDSINGVIYLAEGRDTEAAISFIAIVPYVGDLAKVKYVAIVGKMTKEAALAAKAAGKISCKGGSLLVKSDKKSAVAGLKLILQKTCFAAGTPLLTPDGEKPIEELRVGDRVLSRSEVDPEGPVEAKLVEEVFVNVSPLLRVTVAGREIGTTVEHPFFVSGKGWVAASSLVPGDPLVSHDGQMVLVESVEVASEPVTVYNLRVQDHHTYFVGSRAWGFSVWAHNAYSIVKVGDDAFHLVDEAGAVVRAGTRKELEEHAAKQGLKLAPLGKLGELKKQAQTHAETIKNVKDKLKPTQDMLEVIKEIGAVGSTPWHHMKSSEAKYLAELAKEEKLLDNILRLIGKELGLGP